MAVYWDDVCGGPDNNNSLGVLWDVSISWNTPWNDSLHVPNIPWCCQLSILAWLPLCVFTFFSIFYVIFLARIPTVYSFAEATKLNIIKTLLIFCLVILAIVDIAKTGVDDNDGIDIPPAFYITPGVQIAGYLWVIFILKLEFMKGEITSGFFILLWTLSFVAGVIRFRTIILRDVDDLWRAVTFFISFFISIILFFLSCLADIKDIEKRTPKSTTEEDLKGTAFHIESFDLPPCPEDTSGFLLKYSHYWLFRMLIKGFRGEVKFSDLYELKPTDRSINIVPEFENQLKALTVKRKSYKVSASDIIWLIIKANKGILSFSAFIRLCHCFALFLNPTLLSVLLQFLADDEPGTDWQGYILSTVILISGIFVSSLMQTQFKYAWIVAMRTRTILTSTVYRKAMRYSNSARRTATVGQIVNLMSVDAQKVHDTMVYFHDIWAAPVNAILCTVYMWSVIGPSCMAGIALLVILIPINAFILVGIFGKLQIQQMRHKDTRIRSVNQILAGIKVLKMYAWESSFGEQVRQIRAAELGCVRQQLYILATIGVTWFAAPYLLSLAIFAAYVMSGNILDAEVAFVTQTLIGILNLSLSALPVILGFMVQCTISLRRISKALSEDELMGEVVDRDENMPEMIKIENASMSWGENVEGFEDETPNGVANGTANGKANGTAKKAKDLGEPDVVTNKSVVSLKNITMKVMPNQLVAIVGPVGSGKSTMINTILGELNKLRGSITVRGTLAYVPQQAWLINATLKNNICFAKPYEQKKYNHILEACALLPDLKVLPAGDATEIGEKGINLSGGQKQRISLARAVYQDEDVYLFDDPLSAVDAHVGKHLFEKVIGPKGMLYDKTRVLVTHGVTYLPNVDVIISMKDGEISEMGTYEELIKKDGHFAEFVRTYLQEKEEDEELDEEEKHILERQLSRTNSARGSRKGSVSGESTGGTLRRRKKRTESEAEKKPETPQGDSKLISEEVAEQGGIKSDVLWAYIKNGGLHMFGGLIFFECLYIVAQVLVSLWLTEWTGDANEPDIRDNRDYYLGVYGGLGVFIVIGILFLSLAIYTGGVRAASVMHKTILDRMMKAPMSFFDTTPLGRIINRFSNDMDKLDTVIPTFVRLWMVCLAMVIITIILIAYVTPEFLVVLVPLAVIYMFIQRIYIVAIRQLKRMESIKRSPVYANFDETLSGIVSVRAYKQQHRFVTKNDRLVDNSQIPWYLILVSMRWLGFTAECLSAFMVFFASLFAIASRSDANLAGMSISWAMRATVTINMLVRAASDLETHVVSVERVQEYTTVPTEAPWLVENNRPRKSWPEKGVVKFEDYCTRYREGLDLVLRGISFVVDEGEKMGIVGRTGAGKSSITLALYRIVEAASGAIYIDGVKTSDIGLHDLRNALTIIPQDPVLFSGSLRINLDPFDRHTDEEMWVALENAHLKSFVAGVDEGLEYEVGEGGESLSVGQRQLVCLARALLRRTKILVLDEATAAVDLETDDLIQNTIRMKFTECSVITIAHRLNTIIDYDRVMVLDKGLIVECDNPNKLLADENGVFYSMAKSAGLLHNQQEESMQTKPLYPALEEDIHESTSL